MLSSSRNDRQRFRARGCLTGAPYRRRTLCVLFRLVLESNRGRNRIREADTSWDWDSGSDELAGVVGEGVAAARAAELDAMSLG